MGEKKGNGFLDKIRPVCTVIGNICRGIGRVISLLASWIYKFRAVILSIPVIALSIGLAQDNMERLPEAVGINLQANGEYAMMITRELAVMGPMAVTAVCLLLMFCSRRVLYPWLISLFSLVLPFLLYITNIFPG